MKKEIFLAIIAGGGLGLLIAFGIWRANISLKPKGNDNNPTAANTKSSPSTSPLSGDLKVIVASPFNMAILTQSPTLITGITRAKAYVAVTGEDSDDIMVASDSGTFSSNFDLTGGVNQIQIDAFETNGNEAHTNLLVVYSSQFVALSATEAAAARGYIGTVTDISNSIIQIKTDNGDIQQISGAVNVSYIDTRNDTTKTIKATDVAIGDYLVAMGIKDTNNILQSSRILITDSVKKSTRKAFFGIVTDDSQIGKISVKNPKSGQSVTVTAGTTFQITGATKFSAINKDDKVIVTGQFKDNVIDARTILVVH